MKEDLQTIIDLMEGLKDKMAYGHDDLSERLGRKKPDVEIMKIGLGAKPGMDPGEPDGDEGGMEGDDMPEEFAEGMNDESPEDKLKARLAKLRG